MCNLKSFAFAAASLAAVATLAGCAHSKSPSQPSNKDDSAFVYLLDRQPTWHENTVDTLPPLPQPSNLLSFEVSQNSPLKFFVDEKSIAVGSDGIVRYTSVITSPAGARNVIYEGIRCDTYEWRQYAALNADHDGWDRTVATDWQRIENGNLNAYHAALYQDYFCANKMPAAKTGTIIDNLRAHRTILNQQVR
ncbi:Lipoprotein [Burkholderia plantarii]|nr:Lipoprotein [Burkholderia plantarii]